MAPQTSIPPAANALGTIGTICWCVQLIPQIVRNYRTKSTEGLPASMMFLWSVSGVPFGVYAIVQGFNIPLVVQPQCFCALCGVSWAQCLVYQRKWKPWTATLLLCTLFLCFAGIQTGLVFAIRGPYVERGVYSPVLAVGILAFILLIAGYLPIPFELVKRRGRVVGIDFVFLTIDWCGAFFSLLSLVMQPEFDVLFGTLYAMCCIIEMSMVCSHWIWMLRTRKIRKKAKQAGESFDEFDEGIQWQAKGVDMWVMLRRMVKRFEKSEMTESNRSSDVETGLENEDSVKSLPVTISTE